MSSKPAMMRSSRGVRLETLSGATSTPSASSSSSSFISAIGGFLLRLCRLGLRTVTCQRSYAFGHALFSCVGRIDLRQTTALILELQGAFCQVTGFVFG